MTNPVTHMRSASNSSRGGETYARADWDAARRDEALPVAVARAVSGKDDAKAAGGAWRAKPAATRVFNLVAWLNSENLKLSEIGLALVDRSDPDGQKRARRQAVLSVASYLKILKDHNGTSPRSSGDPPSVLVPVPSMPFCPGAAQQRPHIVASVAQVIEYRVGSPAYRHG